VSRPAYDDGVEKPWRRAEVWPRTMTSGSSIRGSIRGHRC
jgi:hypothetical protein